MIILKNKINTFQFSILLGLSLLAEITLLPNSISCFSMIISVVLAFILQIPNFVAFNNKEIKLPKYLKIITAVFAILISVRLINNFASFFVTSINPIQSKIYVAILVAIALIYPSLKGIESVSRGAILGGFFSLIALLLILFCVPYNDMSLFSDKETVLDIKDGLNLIFGFSPMVLSFSFNNYYDGKKLKAKTIPFIIISLIIGILMCFVKLLNVSEYIYPLYTLSKVSLKFIPMGLSGLFIVLSLICIFFSVLYFSLATKNIIDNNSSIISLFFILTVLLLSIISIAIPQIERIILNEYLLLILYLIITLIVPIIVTIKGNKRCTKS